MNYKHPQIFVPLSTLVDSGYTWDLATQSIGFFHPETGLSLGATASATSPLSMKIAIGSGINKVGSFKTSEIKKANVTGFTGVLASATAVQQITYIGYDEVNQDKSPTLGCDQEYYITLDIDELYLSSVNMPRLRESIRIKTACCADCSTNCDALDCHDYFTTAAADINNHPLLSKYITASVVTSCTGSAATSVFAITVPDPGTITGTIASFDPTTYDANTVAGSYGPMAATSTSGSGTGATFTVISDGANVTDIIVNNPGAGYAIGDTVTFATGLLGSGGATTATILTAGQEGTLLEAIRDLVGAFAAVSPVASIVYSADAESSDGDANATGNVRIELTALAGTQLSALAGYEYLGVPWEEVILTASTEVCDCGLKLVGKALDEFGNVCIPDAVSQIANVVRFKAYVHPAPATTMDFDIDDFCNSWIVTTTQEGTYAIGTGAGLAQRERNFFRNNLANISEAEFFWNPIWNNDTAAFRIDTTKSYYSYRVTWLCAANLNYAKSSPEEHSVEIYIDSTNTTLADSIETFLSNFTGITVNLV